MLRRLLLLAAALPALLVALGGSAAALPRGPPPIQTDCLYYTGPAKCVYNIGFIEFRLGKRVLHVGDTVTGTYTWGLSETRSGRFLTAGEGLRLLRCSGPRVAALGSSGTRTCTWKAVRPTSDWVTSLGMTLYQNASLGAYTENDFYVVVGRENVIEGKITREETDANPTAGQQGIPNVRVRIHGPQSKTVTTNDLGYYVASVRTSGRYRVTPDVPRRYGGRRAVEPRSRVVRVSRSRVAHANFVVADDLTVELSFDRDRVPANGLETITGTITAQRFGQPANGIVVSVMPYGATVSTNPEAVAVPAHFCEISWTNFLRWPDGQRGVTTNVFPFDLTTNDRGEVRFVVQTGTVPGTIPVRVWAKTAAGRLRYEHISRVSDRATIANEATGALGPAGLFGEIANIATAGGLTLPTDPTALAAALASGVQRGLAYAPVRGETMTGVLVYPQGERVAFQGDTGVIGPNSGVVVSPDRVNPAILTAFGGFDAAAKAGQIQPPPSFAAWAIGEATTGWSLVPQTGPVRLIDDLRGWRYLGFPLPKSGGC